MNRKRILFAASLSILLSSIVAVTSRDGSTAGTTASNTGFEDSPRTTWTYGSVFTVGSASTPTPTTCGTIYNAVGDFSATSNPNGSWSYGWETSLGGAFTPYTLVNSTFTQGIDYLGGPDSNCGAPFFPLVAFNHTGSTLDYSSGVSQPANMLSLHPSCNGKLSVVRWTAPTTGWFDVVGLFQGIDTRNTSTDVHVLQNSGTSLLAANINGFGNQAPFNLTRYLTAGDTLDFVVGWGSNANYNADSTGLAVTITAAPVFNIADGDVAGLTAAINSANASGCPTTINLAPNGTYVLTAVADNGDPNYYQGSGAAGLPYIRALTTINGNGATIRRSDAAGTPDFVVLAVLGVGPHNGDLTLNGMTLTGGSLGGLNLVYGSASVQNSTVTQNNGGGINNICGSLTMVNSTVSYNTSGNAYGGGGIFLWKFACAPDKPVANISFSTIFENQNTSGTTAGGDPYGPGYAITAAFGNPGDVIVKNSILASPTRAFYPASACNGALPVSEGHNIVGDNSCSLNGPGDMVNANPLLGPLANNGGPTPTHLPLCNSLAIDGVPASYCSDVFGAPVTTDQRGISRPQGAACDVGSVEAANLTHRTKLFAVSSQGEQSTNEVFRYELGPTAPPTLDVTMTHNSFDRPFGVSFSAAGEMFIVNRGSGSGGGGSVSRFLNANVSPLFNGSIMSSSFNAPHGATFRNGELFLAQRFGAGTLRFLFDGAGNASLNGTLTNGLTSGFPRGATVNPTTGELFVTECCGVNEINRYVFDTSGNAVPNGVITGGGLNNPHDMVFSPWGELFVANVDGNISRFVFDSSGNATPNGELSGNGLCGPIGLAFSPWGELFVSNHFCPRISRWVFDGTFNAMPNGSFSTPATLGELAFVPVTPGTVTIPSKAGPWNQSLNSAFDYGVHDNGPPVVLDASSGVAFTPGSILTVRYVSGMVQAGVGYPFNDANGLPGNVTNNYDAANGRFPAYYMNPGPDVLSMELVGTFANNGVIVGQPFAIGNGPATLTIPTGANQLLLGINDNFYGDNSGYFTVTINGAGNTPPTVSCPSPFTASANSDCLAAVPNVLNDVTASSDCGGPVTLSQSPAAGTLVSVGVTEITVTATDAANNSSSCTTTFTVTDNTPPTIAPMSDITTTTDPAACTARVNFAPTGSDNCSGALFSCSTPSGSAFPIGTTGVTCTATDASGNTAATSFNVTVNNPAPTVSINSPASGAIFAVGTNVTFGGTFVDNAGDLHTAQWSFANNTHNIVQSGVVNETNGTVNANHAFTSPGVYLITLTLADLCGHNATTNVTSPDGLTAMVVVYDPYGGFVTGGGWIDSPAGAYTPEPTLSGRASFGFVSKYQNGASSPTGNTEFQFRVANFNFRGNVYDWLVVAGARAQYKGSGSVNGAGNYGFMLTAIDGQTTGGGGADKFRIKIWDKNNGDTVVYDNQLNALDGADPTTLLGGGSIIIHK